MVEVKDIGGGVVVEHMEPSASKWERINIDKWSVKNWTNLEMSSLLSSSRSLSQRGELPGRVLGRQS